MSWRDELQPASLNGVPFGVLGDEGRFGRRVAVHEYPYKDDPYVEDLGRATRRMTITGFLVENSLGYVGGPVLAQRDALIKAAETPGPLTLVHPTLGRLDVSLPDDGLMLAEKWDTGRYIEFRLNVIETGDLLFPSSTIAPSGLLGSLAASLNAIAGSDFIKTLTKDVSLAGSTVHGVISLGQSVVNAVVGVVADVNVIAGQVSRDATSLFNLGSLLTGDFGRYVNANVSSAFVPTKVNSGGPWTIPALTAAAAAGRASVQSAGSALTAAAQGLDTATLPNFPPAAQGLVGAVAAILPNPGDAIARLGALASYTPTPVPGSGQIAQAAQIASDATAALVRRAALGAMGQAAAAYAPSSYDDAAAVRTTVAQAIDVEVLIAADAGDDGSYNALRQVRQGVINALALAGASVAPLRWVILGNTLPALTVAQRLYQDATRTDQLIAQANPVHPAFMPVRFKALAN